MKLELKHLAPYFPYGLKAKMLDCKIDYVGKQFDEIIGVHQWSKDGDWCLLTEGGSKPSLDRIKPILRNLSDLTKEIEHNGERFVPMERINPVKDFFNADYIESMPLSVPYSLFVRLLEFHFDVFNLIPNGLAIDINTLTNDI